MIALWEDADLAPTHALSVDRADLDMLHAAMGSLMAAAERAAAAQPEADYFADQVRRARRLHLALAKHLAGIRNAEARAGR